VRVLCTAKSTIDKVSSGVFRLVFHSCLLPITSTNTHHCQSAIDHERSINWNQRESRNNLVPQHNIIIMSILPTAIGNFMSWRERHHARMEHDRLENEHQDDASPLPSTIDVPEGDLEPETPTASSSEARVPPAVETILEEDEETGVRTAVIDGEEEEEDDVVPPSDGIMRRHRTVSLAELEEERELARRRTSACILLAVFVLFRLWIEAVVEGDFGLLLLCLVGTSWTARFIRHNREREEELDRRIAAYIENAQGETGTTQVDRSDLRMLSFQAQLALAIMESQRAMVQGGFGHPDGSHGGANRGVSAEAKEHWQHYDYKPEEQGALPASKKGGYGSLAQEDEKAGTDNELANCSICLCEYEDGERLVRLPCSHVYHDECVSSWTTNHVRCPLCNFDLETATTESNSVTSSSPPQDSIV
jgi:hypothetical protein